MTLFMYACMHNIVVWLSRGVCWLSQCLVVTQSVSCLRKVVASNSALAVT